MHSAYLESYGCTHNESDARIIRAILEKEGITLIHSPEKADFIFINTCGVLHTTELRMLSRIRELAKFGGTLVVTGCLPKINEKAIRKAAPEAFLLDTGSLDKIPQLLKHPQDFFSSSRINKLRLPQPRQGLTAIVQIAEGCLGSCSYCAVRFSRGTLHSYPPRDIILASELALKAGARELYITSEDTGCYGLDIGYSLPQLIGDITSLPGAFKVRVGMMNPNYALRMSGLTAAYRSEKVYNFAHLPVQSGSDSVLRAMRRQYSVADFEKAISLLRKAFPDITIATDIIVGFPTETAEDFTETLALLERAQPDITNISRFAVRPGTDAARMKQLPTQEIKRRSIIASRLARKLSLKSNGRMAGSEYDVVALARGRKGGVVGRAPNYRQIVFPGVVGREYRVKVTAAHSNYLQAKTLK